MSAPMAHRRPAKTLLLDRHITRVWSPAFGIFSMDPDTLETGGHTFLSSRYVLVTGMRVTCPCRPLRRSRQGRGTTFIRRGHQTEAGSRVSRPVVLIGIWNGFGMSWSLTGPLPRPRLVASPGRAECVPHLPGRQMAGGLRISTTSAPVRAPPRTTTFGVWQYPVVKIPNR